MKVVTSYVKRTQIVFLHMLALPFNVEEPTPSNASELQFDLTEPSPEPLAPTMQTKRFSEIQASRLLYQLAHGSSSAETAGLDLEKKVRNALIAVENRSTEKAQAL